MFQKNKMVYRRLGNSGLLVSALSFGFWTNMNSSIEQNQQLVKFCLQSGINYFDTAQTYQNGKNEQQLGIIFSKLKQDRSNYVISTKIWKAKDACINSNGNTNKKHVRQSILKCLKRLQMDYVDIVYAHTFDENTPLEQICRAFHEIIEEGYAFYWGTSNWDADKIFQVFQICEKYNLHKPIAAQNQYNMINRKQIQEQYLTLLDKYKYGLVAYSPLLGGYLTGKYLNQANQQGRFKVEETSGWGKQILSAVYYHDLDMKQIDLRLKQLKYIAQNELNCKLIHLAIAWVLRYDKTSTALIGARNINQLKDIIQTIQILPRFTIQIQIKINKILQTQAKPQMDWKSFTPKPHVRPLS